MVNKKRKTQVDRLEQVHGSISRQFQLLRFDDKICLCALRHILLLHKYASGWQSQICVIPTGRVSSDFVIKVHKSVLAHAQSNFNLKKTVKV